MNMGRFTGGMVALAVCSSYELQLSSSLQNALELSHDIARHVPEERHNS